MAKSETSVRLSADILDELPHVLLARKATMKEAINAGVRLWMGTAAPNVINVPASWKENMKWHQRLEALLAADHKGVREVVERVLLLDLDSARGKRRP